MRILQITQSFPPMVSGAAAVAQRLSEGLSARGHIVLVLAASDTGRDYTVSGPNYRLRRLASLRNPFRVGQRFTFLPRKAILAELTNFQPDVVHTHDPLGMGMVGVRAAKAKGIPTVLTAHQLPWFISPYLPDFPGLRRSAEALGWVFARRVASQCTRMVVPTRPVAELVSARGIFTPAVINNGIHPLFSPIPTSSEEEGVLRQKYGLDPNLPVILYVGRVDADKRVELVVQAAASLLKSSAAQLLVIGDGARRPAVMALCRSLGIRDRAVFAGFVPVTGDLPGLYRLASVFVTAGELETQCLTLLEALSSGLPAITVQTGVMAEIVQDGVNGFLVAPGDAGAMTGRITDLLQTPHKAREMGQAGLLVSRRYSEQQMVQSYEDLYRQIINVN